jgi:general secretion pathway protein M
MRAELDKERSNEDFKAFYYDAETPALAGAELQRELQDMVRAAGARLINTQFLPAGADEQPPRVRIRAQFQGTTESLLDVIYRIEQARPFLFVDQLSVRASARRVERPNSRVRGRRAPVRNVEPQGQLTVRLDVFGYALGGGQ